MLSFSKKNYLFLKLFLFALLSGLLFGLLKKNNFRKIIFFGFLNAFFFLKNILENYFFVLICCLVF